MNPKNLLFILGFLILAGCHTSRKPMIKLTPTTFYALPDWQQDAEIAEACKAFQKSCPVLLKAPRNKDTGLGTRAKDWDDVCEKAKKVNLKSPRDCRAFFEQNFIPYHVSNNGNYEGLFTGYYESELQGSLFRTERFHYPLYKKPGDLVCPKNKESKWGRLHWGRIIPYHDRASIDKGGALKGQNLEFVWVDDPVEAFFLHIQGSGRIHLTNGRVMRVGYAGCNGHAFVPIGRELVKGSIMDTKDVSMQSIRKWMAANPEKAEKLMHMNPSYVFFQENPGDGPLGCMGIAVTPGRSLAVDKSLIPMGAPIWLDAAHPDNYFNIRRLVIAQDTGGAIRGAVRGDYFWGYGKEAMEKAGKMKAKGQYYILLPNHVWVPKTFILQNE